MPGYPLSPGRDPPAHLTCPHLVGPVPHCQPLRTALWIPGQSHSDFSFEKGTAAPMGVRDPRESYRKHADKLKHEPCSYTNLVLGITYHCSHCEHL